MSDIIRLLPDSVANQIAAGEVIQRPAAVIKELVENAVDAGANDIRIIVRDAGRTLIQVSDNGKGMSVTDARLAFERHATSKISNPEDLFALKTMGFRGEALPSICAVSRVELRTRTEDAEVGTHIVIEGSRVETQEPCMCEKGADFQVKNLFFNVPARRRFLSSDATELSKIVREFERMALANPSVKLSLDTGSRTISLRSGPLLQRIGEIWKNNLKMQLIPVETEFPIVKIKGYISRPEAARRRNPLQFLLVNGRNMSHPGFRSAILECYENLIAPGTQPCFFMTFQVDPSTIDVNISPTKQNIKFQDEYEIRRILSTTVRSALARNDAMPSIDFSLDPLPVNASVHGGEIRTPDLGLDRSYNPFDSTPAHGGTGGYGNKSRQLSGWEKLYDSFISGVREEEPQEHPSLPEMDLRDEDSLPPLCIQCGTRYIAASTPGGIVIIDAFRAQVRVLYEKFLKNSAGQVQSIQQLMFADTVELDAVQREALSGVEEEIRRMGISLEYVENSTWRISAMPEAFDGRDARDAVLAVLDAVSEEISATIASPAERAALAMARSAAVRSGRTMSEREMEHIVSELFKLADPAYTPDGKTVMVTLEGKKLAALFS